VWVWVWVAVAILAQGMLSRLEFPTSGGGARSRLLCNAVRYRAHDSPHLPMGRRWGASAGQGQGPGYAQGQGAKVRFWVCGGKGGFGCGYHNVDSNRNHCFHCKLCWDFSKRPSEASPSGPPKAGGKGGVWAWPKKTAPVGAKPAPGGGAPKAGAPAGSGNFATGAKWFKQANGEEEVLPDVEMVVPPGGPGGEQGDDSEAEQRVKDDIASSRKLAKFHRGSAKTLMDLAVNGSQGGSLAQEIARQVALAEGYEQETVQQLALQRSELPLEVQLERKQAFLKSTKGGLAKASEEHKVLVAKGQAIAAETTAKAEQVVNLEAKVEAVAREVQEVFGKMAARGDEAPPQAQQVRPPFGGGDEFTEAEKLEMYAARTARAERALWDQQQQHAAAVQAAVVEEQNRAALARAAEAEAARSAEEAEAARPPTGQADSAGGGKGKAAGPSSGRGLEGAMASNMAARRKATAPYPVCPGKETEEVSGAPSQGDEGTVQ
jgi:hypothetical protein